MRFQGTSRRIRKISVAKFIVYVTQNLLHSFVRFGGRSRFGPAAQSGVRGRGRYQRPRLQDQHGDHRHQEQARLAGGYRHFAQIRLGVARPADFLRAAGVAHQARGERRNRPQVQFGRHPRAGGVPAHPFPAHLRRSGLHGGQQLQAEARGRPARFRARASYALLFGRGRGHAFEAPDHRPALQRPVQGQEQRRSARRQPTRQAAHLQRCAQRRLPLLAHDRGRQGNSGRGGRPPRALRPAERLSGPDQGAASVAADRRARLHAQGPRFRRRDGAVPQAVRGLHGLLPQVRARFGAGRRPVFRRVVPLARGAHRQGRHRLRQQRQHRPGPDGQPAAAGRAVRS